MEDEGISDKNGRIFRIMIVDDERLVRRALERTFKRNDLFECVISLASDAVSALGELEKREFDLIIADFKMPGMNGSELCQRIRQAPGLKELPILMITGKLFESDRQRLFEQFRLVDAIPKPFSPRNVVRLVAEQFTPVSAGISS